MRRSRVTSQRPVAMALMVAVMAAALLGGPVVGLAAPVSPPWRQSLPQRTHGVISVGGVVLDVTLAVTEPERELGLGDRDGLAQGTGMLFLYPTAEYRTFWMKGMRFCLDIIWIESGQVVGAAQSVCPLPPGTPDGELPRYRSPIPVHDVLEVPAGWLVAHHFGAGTPVEYYALPGVPAP